jgi:hypothetical protein
LNLVYVLKTVNSDLTACNGFKYPIEGKVSDEEIGLYGFLMGEGYWGFANWNNNAKWLVIEVEQSNIIKIYPDRINFRLGNIVHCGDRKSATNFIIEKGANPEKVLGAYQHKGNNSRIIGVEYSTLIGGDFSILIGGYKSILTSGIDSKLLGGVDSILSGGIRSSLSIKWINGSKQCLTTTYVGIDGILPNIPYKVDKKGNFIQVS